MTTEKYTTHSEEETIELGNKFAERLLDGDTVAFFGDLGSGKTEFIKGVCSYFDVEEIVTSPTFTIINQYFANKNGDQFPIYHLDLYRINNQKELEDTGFDECINAPVGIKLVEWAEKADGYMPEIWYKVSIDFPDDNENSRLIEISTVREKNL